MRRFALLMLGTAIVAACASFGSNDDSTPAADGGSEAGVDALPLEAGSNDAGSDATLIYDDLRTTGCNGFSDKGVSATLTAGACLFCVPDGGSGFASKRFPRVYGHGSYVASLSVKNDTLTANGQLQLSMQLIRGLDTLYNKSVMFGATSTFVSQATPATQINVDFDVIEIAFEFLQGSGCVQVQDLRVVDQP